MSKNTGIDGTIKDMQDNLSKAQEIFKSLDALTGLTPNPLPQTTSPTPTSRPSVADSPAPETTPSTPHTGAGQPQTEEAKMIESYRLVEEADTLGHRIYAVTEDDIEICGAYRPVSLNDWRVYLSKMWPQRTGLPQPHKVHVCSRDDAKLWVNMLAYAYTHMEDDE